ncbi:MAG: glycosyltransferase family 39 protein [Oceanicaulis sp.]
MPTPARAAVVAALLALFAGLAGVFTLPVLDRDEARYAQAAAQMIESGNFVEIRYLDVPRNKKPVGIYWMQAAAVALVSSEEARAIWAYRLPSLLGAALAAAFAALAAGRLYGGRAALGAGATLAVGVLLGTEAGIAKTDAVLTASCAAAFYAFVRLRLAFDLTDPTARRNGGRAWAAAWWAAVGIGALIKGPVAPVAAGLAVLALAGLERRWRWALPLAFWPGPLLAALIVAPWLVAVQLMTEGGFLAGAIGGDLAPKIVSGDEGHGAPPGLHLLLLPVLFFPAIVFLPAGVRAAIKDWRASSDPAARRAGLAAKLVIAFAVPIWIAFELLPTKLPHYVLPAYPALAVLAGLGFARLSETAPLWRWTGAALLLAGALALAVAMRWVPAGYGGPEGAAWWLSSALLLAAVITAVTAGRRRPGAALIAAVATGLVFHVAVRGVIVPGASDLFLSPPAAGIALERTANGAPLYSTYTEPSFAFLTGGDLTLTGPAAVTAEPPPAPFVLAVDTARWLEGAQTEDERETRQAALDRLTETACAVDLVEGFNYSRGDPTSILILDHACAQEPRP